MRWYAKTTILAKKNFFLPNLAFDNIHWIFFQQSSIPMLYYPILLWYIANYEGLNNALILQ